MDYIATFKTANGKTGWEILCAADFPFFFKDLNKNGSTLISLIEQNGETFGSVCWADEDLANALELHDIEPTEENIAKLKNEVDTHWLTDAMIETGWDFIYQSIYNIKF